MRLAAATACGLAAAPLFVAPASRSPVVTRLGVSDDVALRAATQAGASSTSSSVPLVAMGLVGAAAAASLSRRSSQVKRAAFDPTQELGIQAPVGFWDPLGFCDDGDEASFKRRRAVEIKHGRVAMIATIGYIVPEYYRWPGDLSPSEGISFADVPNGFGAFSKVPMLGWAQIILFAGVMEGRFLSNETAPGDYGLGKYGALGLFGSVSDPEERKTKLNAEIANGRLAMFGIIGLFFQNGVTGTSGSEMYGFGENSAAVLLRIIVPVFIVLAITGENFRQGPGEKFLKFYERKDYFGKDRI
eukprot:CAMPEP_0113818478 /NCGR_PEP_ID=MMETSP0328-20130328/260_1 /TAXON_ID=39455 /ORGANISM="Alexandrium minutum" /LENGTH=300 /DNA_ID=CAMNT_0000786413 /DNA_START=96 /DNA_END=998 /DNA_ORIENTATION=+ /assembly_acc=CAM_ASM_000350